VYLIRKYYPDAPIYIIDDDSDAAYVQASPKIAGIKYNVIASEYPRRGELLPLYYYWRDGHTQWTHRMKYAVCVHDSTFIHAFIPFQSILSTLAWDGIALWEFDAKCEYDKTNTLRLLNAVTPHLHITKLKKEIVAQTNFQMQSSRWNVPSWKGCFGVQMVVSHDMLCKWQQQYALFTSLIDQVHTRNDRCCLERIFGYLLSVHQTQHMLATSTTVMGTSLFGSIFSCLPWEYSFRDYVSNIQKGWVPNRVVKVWTGR
jgi:hypothetical protein